MATFASIVLHFDLAATNRRKRRRTEERHSRKKTEKFSQTFLQIFAAPFNKLSHLFILCVRIESRADWNRSENWFRELAKQNTRLKPHESSAITMKNGWAHFSIPWIKITDTHKHFSAKERQNARTQFGCIFTGCWIVFCGERWPLCVGELAVRTSIIMNMHKTTASQ